MKSVPQALLFWSSYSPLLAVFALLDTFGHGTASIVCLVLAVLGLACTSALFLVDRNGGTSHLKVQTVGSRGGDVLAYVATYLVPFAATSATTGREQAAMGIFIAIIAILFVRLNLFYVNPVLALVGLRAYEIGTTGGTTVVLLSRQKFIAPGSTIDAYRISDYVWRQK